MDFDFFKDDNGNLIEGPLKICPEIFNDQRGFFYESWNKKIFNKIIGENINFVQDNNSNSKKGVLRGLHYQSIFAPQGKLVRCTSGEIFDVFVDLRLSSKTFGKWAGIELNTLNKNIVWIPKGFAHGFLTLSQTADVEYKTTNFWNKKEEKTIIWNDKKLNIKWPIEKIGLNNLTISEKDMSADSFVEQIKRGHIF